MNPRREKLFSFMDKIGETPLIGLLYESRDENFEKAMGETSAFGTRKGGVDNLYTREGVKSIWELSGKPKIKVGTHQPQFNPRDVGTLMSEYTGKRPSLFSKWKSKWGKDVVQVGGRAFGASELVEELSHAIQWENPKKWSPYSSRKELFKHKMEEVPRRHAGEKIYEDISTDEGYTHGVVAPKLYQYMRDEGYSF